MGITQRAISRQANKAEEAKQDAQRQVQMLISSEGIETMSDAELSQLAQAAGYTLSSLRKIREAVKSQSQAKITKAQNDLVKQQQTMDLARQRETRLAGGGTPTPTPTPTPTDREPFSPFQLQAIADQFIATNGKDKSLKYLAENNTIPSGGKTITLSESEKQQLIQMLGGSPTQTGTPPPTGTTSGTSGETWVQKIGKTLLNLLPFN